MIDNGRKADLMILTADMANQDYPDHIRDRAARVFYTIKLKIRDTYITKMRVRLIAATQNEDPEHMKQISNRLMDYERKHYSKRKF